jgi:hypothetical protein
VFPDELHVIPFYTAYSFNCDIFFRSPNTHYKKKNIILQDYNTIIGVIQMRQNECAIKVIHIRYHIDSSTVQLILKRFNVSGFSLE